MEARAIAWHVITVTFLTHAIKHTCCTSNSGSRGVVSIDGPYTPRAVYVAISNTQPVTIIARTALRASLRKHLTYDTGSQGWHHDYEAVEEVIKDRTPYIFGRLCSEKETPTSGTQILAQTLLYSDSVHEILQSNLYCSPRAIGDGNQKSDTAIIGRRHFFPKMAYHRLCSDQNRL